MADIAMDRPPQIEPVAAPPRSIAAGQPCAHHFRQPRRRRMRPLYLCRIGHVTEVELGEIVGTRGALHAAFAGTILRRFVGRRDLVGCRLAADPLFGGNSR